jgi:NADH:ubiquinone oxidoreductase subunit F (NADH-binding)
MRLVEQNAPVRFRGADLIREVAAAGLTGRGGAGFPTARKLAAVAAGVRPIVVANAAEGEPASAKDRTLLARAPGLVLDGLRLAAEAVGAVRTYAYVPAGTVLDGSGVEVVVAPDRFVAGEESAVVAAVRGRPAVPIDKLRRVTESALVQNVETLAHLALIARYGAAWFRAAGTRESPGTFLATVSGAVRSPAVYEHPYGVPLGTVLAAGGATAPLGAVLVGGFHGAWVPADDDLRVDHASLRRFQASPGAGVVIALAAHACGLAESAAIVSYLAGQSAGRCGPCVNGLPALSRALADPHAPDEVERLATLVTGRGACAHPDGTARFVRSSLRAFAADVAAHRRGTCLGSVIR